jgi:putative transcriptional regulator
MTVTALKTFGTALLLFASTLGMPFAPAHAQSNPQAAQEVPEAVVLVAKPELQSPVLSSSVLLVMPLEGGGHAGFILNKPTPMTVSDAFPDDEPSQKVRDRVYLGGPINPNIIFALVRRDSAQGRSPGSIQFTKDLALAMTSDSVDEVIRNESARARFFAGAMLWRPGELRQQVSQGAWYVRDADAEVALSRNEKLWEELVADSERHARAF